MGKSGHKIPDEDVSRLERDDGMLDLSTDFVGLKLDNPIIVASAGITETVKRMQICQEQGAAAVVMKSYFEEEICRQAPTPRFRILRHGARKYRTFAFYSYEQASEWDIERYAQEVSDAKSQLKIKIIPSINCVSSEGWVRAAKLLEQAGADAIELNTSCPHGSITFSGGAVEQAVVDTVRPIRDAVSIPLIAKISSMLTDALALVKALEEIGIDGVTIFNRQTGLDIDIENEQPIMHRGYGGFGGPWAIHYPLRWISQIRPEVKLDIAGSGGVWDWKDAVKYLLVGANVVQVCTAVYLQGYDVIGKLLKGLQQHLKRKGYQAVDEIRGKANKHLLDMQQVDRRKRFTARIDDSCVGCGICQRACTYWSVSEAGEKYKIDAAVCEGCGLCVELCPHGSIELVPLEEK